MDISKFRYKKFRPSLILKLMRSIIVLWLIKNKERHGYELIKEMKNMGFIHFTPAKAYPLLKFMYSNGWIERERRDRRIIYHITKKGRQVLQKSKIWFRKGRKREFFKEMIGC